MPLENKDKEILSTQSGSKTGREWVDFFQNKYTYKQIWKFCNYHGYPLAKITAEEKSRIQSQNARKWHINENYFKTWNRNMAYILGLWFADGCIYRGKMFDITLHKKDKYILKQIAQELEYEGNLYDYVDRQAARLNFSCVVMYNDIVALGGKECKSNDIVFPDVPEKYLSDFVRGYFDGDGCVMQLKNKRLNSAFTSGSKQFLDSLWQILKDKANVVGGSYDASCLSLKFGKKDTISIGKYIYQNNPELFLKRKREKFPI